MNPTAFRRIALGLLALGCASCNFAPDYERPAAAVPAAYKEGSPVSADGAAAWRPARPGDDAVRADWWKLYGDPVLDTLEPQVRISNQTIRAAEANFRNSRALLLAARSSLFPTVTAAPAVTRLRSSQTYVNSSANQGGSNLANGASSAPPGTIVNEYDLPADASYEIDLWGRVRNAVAASAFSAQASAADLATAILSTQAELAQDYFQLRALDEERRVYDQTVSSYRQNLSLTRTLFRSGIDSDEDLATAQVQLDTVVAQATDVGVARAQFEHAIAVLLGQPPSQFSITPAPFKPAPPPIPVGIPSDLLERRPDIAAAERQVAAANAEIGVARTAYFPSLSLNAAAGFETSTFSRWLEWPSRFWSVGPQLSGTLFSLGALRAANEEAEASYDQTVANYRQAVLAAFQAVEDNLAAGRILDQEETEERTAVRSAEHYLALSMTRYRSGIDSALNVAIAQTTVLANRQTQIQVELRRLDASVALIMALGGGWDVSQLPTRKQMLARPPKWSPANASQVVASGPTAPPNPPAN